MLKKILSFILVFLIISNSLFAQWTKTNRPCGASIKDLYVKGNDIFAAVDNFGVYLLTHNGASWTAVNNRGLTSKHIRAIAGISDNLFVGTDKGVFISTNNGNDWTPVNSGLTNTNIQTLAIHKALIFVATDSGIFLSSNNGLNWTAANSGLKNQRVFKLVTDGINLYAATFYHGIFLTTDNGTNWVGVNTGLPDTFINSFTRDSVNLYAGTGQGVFISSDKGTNWKSIYSIPGNVIFSIIPCKSYLVLGSYNGQYLCKNSSTIKIEPGVSLGVFSSTVKDSMLFVGTPEGIFLVSENGMKWTSFNSGLPEIGYINSVAVMDTVVFAGTDDHGLFYSSDKGINWKYIKPDHDPSASCILSLAVLDTTLFFSSKSGISTLTEHLSSNGLPIERTYIINRLDPIIGYNILNIYARQKHLIARPLSGTFLYKEKQWINISNYGFRDFVFQDTNLFASLDKGVYLSIDTARRWEDTGRSWNQVNSGLPNLNINAFTIVGADLFVATDSGIYKSNNSGKNWTITNSTLKNIRAFETHGICLFALAQKGGIFFSIDKGINWTPCNSGLPEKYYIYPPLNSLHVNKNDIYLFIDNQLWRRPLSEIIPPILEMNARSITLGNIRIGQRKDSTITILNAGNDTLKISNIQSTNVHFSVSPFSKNLLPGQSIIDTIQFTPDKEGLESGFILITSNAKTSPDSLAVIGNGLPSNITDIPGKITIAFMSKSYPNPFNSAIKITYRLPERCKVKLNIYNSFGQPLIELVNSVQNEGIYEIEWRAKTSPGIYYYNIKAFSVDTRKPFIDRQKIVLLP